LELDVCLTVDIAKCKAKTFLELNFLHKSIKVRKLGRAMALEISRQVASWTALLTSPGVGLSGNRTPHARSS